MNLNRWAFLALLMALSMACATENARATDPEFPLLQGFTPVGIAGDDVEQGHRFDPQCDVARYSYFSGDLRIFCEIAFPADYGESEVPALVICHGGIDGVTPHMRDKALELAEDGFLVVMPSYRGEDGSDGEIEVAAGEVDDVLACYDLLRDCGTVDSDRIALIGTSHGALICALAASRDSEIPAVVCAYGVMDIVGWWYYLRESGQEGDDELSIRIYGGGPLDHPTQFAQRSALRVACDIVPPVLIMQGANDTLVPPSQAQTMVDAFERCGKTNFEYRLYSGVGHGFLWLNEENIERRGENAVSTAQRAWNDALSFIYASWQE